MRDPAIGTKIKQFTLTDKIGQGANGLIYEAVDSISQCFYAVKFVHIRNTAEGRAYHDEVFIMKRLSGSSNFAEIYEHFLWESFGVIVMELYQGDLLHLITSQDKIPFETIQHIFKQICLAVAILHENNVAHMDLKPENIFLGCFENMKLGDFGAVICEEAEKILLDKPRGTLHYMAPEVARNEMFDPQKADIWSLGILLHVLLFSVWPFQYESERILPEIIAKGNVTLSDMSNYPKDLQILMKRMTHKKPSERPSIHEIVNSPFFSEIDCSEYKNFMKDVKLKYRAPSSSQRPTADVNIDKNFKKKFTPKAVKRFILSNVVKKKN